MALRKRDLAILLFILITALFLVLALVTLSACGEDKRAPAETDQVIDQAAVAAMDADEFRAVMTNAADRLVAHLGSDDDTFLAVLFAVDRGYDAYQLLTGSLSDRVRADGRIAAADGSTIAPARTTTRIFSLPDDTADAPDRPVLLASLAGGLFVADSTAYGGAEMDLGVGGMFPINDALGVIGAGFDASRAKVEAEVEAESQLRELQEEHAKIALILAARGYDAQQITEAAILGQIRIFLEPVEGELPNLCWYIEHTSGKVLRPVNSPLDIFAEMSCPAPDKEAPTTYDREVVTALLDEWGMGEYGPTGGVSGGGEAGTSDGEPDGGETAASSPEEEGSPWVFEGKGLFRRSVTYYPDKINNVKATEVCEDPACPYVLTLFPDRRASLHVTRGFGFNADTGECFDADGNMYWGTWEDGSFSILGQFSSDGPIFDESFLITGTFTANLAQGGGGYDWEDNSSIYDFEDPGLVRKVD
ncbi:MAG: hypothetical protein JXA87_07695 [Thermoleophilia bacterium]|nr:hypothetical protein [Thermoleophilia bacterium]